jgi:RNA polymerase sigma factor (sigma-70 family)
VPEINEIIVACQNGERSAQKALYQMFAPKMFGVCLRYARCHQAAEDFLQDGFIRVFEKIDKFRFEGSFEGWMRRIFVNLIVESYRKARINTELTDNYPEPAIEDDPDGGDENSLSLDVLLRFVQQLPDRYRLVFNLYVLDELTHEEIALQLNISIGTSKSNLSRARKWLQERLRDHLKMEVQGYEDF